MRSQSEGQVAQNKPLTTVVNEQVAENNAAEATVVAENTTTADGCKTSSTAPNATVENVTGVIFSVVEFFLSFFGFIGIVTNPQFSTLAAFIYIATFLVATLKEVAKFRFDGLFKINLGMLGIAGLQVLLLILLVNGNLNQGWALFVTGALKVVLAFVPMRIAAYGYYYVIRIIEK